ncbi:hypothetical protein ABH19_05290 [Leptospirillum sp. Group II 'CF-1']|nr:hypothetical protein ABH19_05290 [Leptospirillum sp. Group II 'CF-1']
MTPILIASPTIGNLSAGWNFPDAKIFSGKFFEYKRSTICYDGYWRSIFEAEPITDIMRKDLNGIHFTLIFMERIFYQN